MRFYIPLLVTFFIISRGEIIEKDTHLNQAAFHLADFLLFPNANVSVTIHQPEERNKITLWILLGNETFNNYVKLPPARFTIEPYQSGELKHCLKAVKGYTSCSFTWPNETFAKLPSDRPTLVQFIASACYRRPGNSASLRKVSLKLTVANLNRTWPYVSPDEVSKIAFDYVAFFLHTGLALVCGALFRRLVRQECPHLVACLSFAACTSYAVFASMRLIAAIHFLVSQQRVVTLSYIGAVLQSSAQSAIVVALLVNASGQNVFHNHLSRDTRVYRLGLASATAYVCVMMGLDLSRKPRSLTQTPGRAVFVRWPEGLARLGIDLISWALLLGLAGRQVYQRRASIPIPGKSVTFAFLKFAGAASAWFGVRLLSSALVLASALPRLQEPAFAFISLEVADILLLIFLLWHNRPCAMARNFPCMESVRAPAKLGTVRPVTDAVPDLVHRSPALPGGDKRRPRSEVSIPGCKPGDRPNPLRSVLAGQKGN